jgi:hypothetical protein
VPLVQCPNCRTELDIPADWVGESIQCGVCQTEFVARPRPTARPRRDDDYDDRPRRRRRPKQKGGGGKLLLILGGVGLVLLLMCGGGIGWLVYSFIKPIEFAESAWNEYTFPDGGASVHVPVPLSNHPMPNPGFGITTRKDSWVAPGPKDAAFVFGVIDCPADNPVTLEDMYGAERDEVVKSVKGRVVSERSLTAQGCQAKEFEFSSGEAHGLYRLVYLQEQDRKRFFMIMAAGRNISPADRSRFVESFKIKSRK